MEIPGQFVLETVVAVSASGINRAMIAWGDLLLAQHSKSRYAYRDDVVVQVLGYSTDSECIDGIVHHLFGQYPR